MDEKIMTGDFEHYHCPICGEPFPTKEKADACFTYCHDELATLRHIAFEVFCAKYFAKKKKSHKEIIHVVGKEVWNNIEELNKRFGFVKVQDGCISDMSTGDPSEIVIDLTHR